MNTKILTKNVKVLLIEEKFNDELEDLLWRLRQVDRKSITDIAQHLSVDKIFVSEEEVTEWLAYLGIEDLLPKEIIKPQGIEVNTPPKPKQKKSTTGAFDPNKGGAAICDDSCPMAAFCRYYERYYGKRCVVDIQAKNEFLSPLIKYIEKTYGRDEDLKNIYAGIAQQAALLHQITQRKIRYLNIKGVTQIERKIDPSTGRLVENEIPNPLGPSILNDTKQIISMLKEMGLTPKSTKDQDTGESDPASLARAIHKEQLKKQEDKLLTEVKQRRYQLRGQITSADQLLNLIEEKKQFNKATHQVFFGEDSEESIQQESSDDILEPIENNSEDTNLGKKADSDEENSTNIAKKSEQDIKDALVSKILDGAPTKRSSTIVEVPDDIQKVLDRLNKNGGK